MDCPVCKTVALTDVVLEADLWTQHCDNCGGHWIGLNAYRAWLDLQSEILPEKAPSSETPEAMTVKRAKLCPQCDHLLLKYKLGRGTEITLDHCSQCGGVWFDKNEWAILKDRNLHDEVYRIFTQSWQKQVREEMSRENLSQHYAQKFGAANYAKIREIKAWLVEHPETTALMAYLQDVDPYK